LIDTITALRTLRDRQSPWIAALYGNDSLHDGVLEELCSVSQTPVAALDDAVRLQRWREQELSLHDVWGPLLRRKGGMAGLPDLPHSGPISAKLAAKVMRGHVFGE